MTGRRGSTLAGLATAVLVMAGLATPIAAAQDAGGPTDLLISEYVEGSSFNKAVELYNGTGAEVSLGDYVLSGYHNGDTTTSYNITLQGTLASGETYVLAHSSSAAEILAVADQTSGAGLWNGDDALVLRHGGVVVDSFGTIGVDPGDSWGTPSTQNNTLRRNADVCAGDTNPDDDFDPGVEWTGFGNDVFDGLGSHSVACDGGGGGSDVVINEYSASTDGTDVEYLEVFGAPDTDYGDLTILQVEGDSGSSARGRVVSDTAVGTTDAAGLWHLDLPANFLQNGTLTLLLVAGWDGTTTLDEDQDGTIDAVDFGEIVDGVAVHDGGTGDLTYAQPVLGPNYDGLSGFPPGGASRIPDGQDTDTAADWVRNDFDLAGIEGETGTPEVGEAYNTPGAPNEVIEASPGGACGDPTVTIGSVQGSGDTSPLVGETVQIEGTVVGDFQTGGFDGYYVQDAGDADPATSDGIFVFDEDSDVAPGDRVHVTGAVSEFFGMTELTPDTVEICSTGNDLPAPTEVVLPVDDVDDLERFEGMYVTLPQDLAILEYFNYDRFGEIVIGTERQYQPTAVFEPYSDEAEALADLNRRSRITLDDGRSFQNPDPAIHPNGEEFTLDNRFRGGDLVTNATGVLDYRFNLYRVQPTEGADFTVANPRPDVPEVGGRLQVAAFNVLNYFPTIDTGAPVCGPDNDQDCRGADTQLEFERQEAKIVAALAAMDADVVGLMEIENSPTAVETLVAALNAEVGADTYAAVETGTIGTDAIKVGLVYKTDSVDPKGEYAILDSSVDPRFNDEKNRPVLAQTFVEHGTGADVTVAVNHLKSKGSDCGPGDDDPVQGNCNLTRTLAAQALVDWLDANPTRVHAEEALVIGDLNSYDEEDPIDALVAGGYTDLLEQFQGEYAYTYVFDGQLGHLDYGLANEALVDQVTGAAAWHANTDEPDLIDYDMSFKRDAQDALYAPDPYRASDHDAVIVGLELDRPGERVGQSD